MYPIPHHRRGTQHRQLFTERIQIWLIVPKSTPSINASKHMTQTTIRDKKFRANRSCERLRNWLSRNSKYSGRRSDGTPPHTPVRSAAIAQHQYPGRDGCRPRETSGLAQERPGGVPVVRYSLQSSVSYVSPSALIHSLSFYSPERHHATLNIAPRSQTFCVRRVSQAKDR